MSRHNLPTVAAWKGNDQHPRFDNCDDACLLCGRPIVRARSFAVWLVGGGGQLATHDEPVDVDEDMGAYWVGSGCARKIPDAFRLPGGQS